MVTQRAERIDFLTTFAKTRIRPDLVAQAAETVSKLPPKAMKLIHPAAVQLVMREAMGKYKVTKDTAESYAYAVFLNIKREAKPQPRDSA